MYAPISGQDRSFHRTVFVFCCKTDKCYTCNNNSCIKGNSITSVAASYSQQSRIDTSAQICLVFALVSHFLTTFSRSVFVSVFRSQLPRRNEFYPFNPPPGLCQNVTKSVRSLATLLVQLLVNTNSSSADHLATTHSIKACRHGKDYFLMLKLSNRMGKKWHLRAFEHGILFGAWWVGSRNCWS